MKRVCYICPKHPEVVLCEEETAENIRDVASKYILKPIVGFFAFVDVGAFPDFGIGEIGPFTCEKCDRNYFKWECNKHES